VVAPEVQVAVQADRVVDLAAPEVVLVVREAQVAVRADPAVQVADLVARVVAPQVSAAVYCRAGLTVNQLCLLAVATSRVGLCRPSEWVVVPSPCRPKNSPTQNTHGTDRS